MQVSTVHSLLFGVLGFLNYCPAFAGQSAVPAQPGNLQVLHRSGQSFVTWTERSDLSDERYRIYRHRLPITAATLAQARLLQEVWEGSGRFFADRYNPESGGNWQARYVDRYVITPLGAPLSAGTGLVVWTLEPSDFDGYAGSQAYYAVTTVSAAGIENVGDFSSGNAGAAISEQVADPAPVEILRGAGGLGHVYIQYMNLRFWNATFHAPNARNIYYGLPESDKAAARSIQYAYSYSVGEPDPANCSGSVPARTAAYLDLHGWADNSYGPASGASEYYCAFQIRPVDVSETWHFGFARNQDYRQPGEVRSGDTIVNYTEQRLLRMVYDLLRDPQLGPRIDPNRIYVTGHSMGGSGALALALRYPNLFAAAYASQPMTNYRTSVMWESDVTVKWGAQILNLPIFIQGPGNWAQHLQRYNGTGVWDWQNHQLNLSVRAADEIVPLGLAHGRSDTAIDWATQGRPIYALLDAGRRAWGGFIDNSDHTWMGFAGLPPNLQMDSELIPFWGMRVIRNESVPGLSNASGNSPLPPPDRSATASEYNQNLEWSASWKAWDGPPVDQPGEWGISLRSIDGQTRLVDVTPRRLQSFTVADRSRYVWENRRVTDNSLIASGVVTSAEGLITVPAFQVSVSGNRLRLRRDTGATTTSTLTATTSTTVRTSTSTTTSTRTVTTTTTTTSSSSTTIPAGRSRCDLNNDGRIDVQDLQLLITVVISGQNSGDINNDGSTDILDVQILANVILMVASCPAPPASTTTSRPSTTTLTSTSTSLRTTTTSSTVQTSTTSTTSILRTTTTSSTTRTSTTSTTSNTSTTLRVRPWKDTSRGIHVFNDQLASNMSDAQVRFSATHYAGTQKMTRREADRLRAIDPDFMILHYRLGLGLGYREVQTGCRPLGDWLLLVEGNDWIREYPASEPPSSWFFPWGGQPRVLNCDWGWYLMELNESGFRQYWHGEVLRQIQANGADGVFMDSLSVPNFLGPDRYNPPLPDDAAAFESAWTTRINNWLDWLKSQPLGNYRLVPNAAAWINSRDAVDYSRADGVMIEGFALEADLSPYELEDWKLQMNRALRLVSAGKAILAQSYVNRPEDRMFALACYLLIRGSRTYINLELDLDPEWWPEYDIPIGLAQESASSNVDLLWDGSWQLYRRRFDNSMVLAYPEGISSAARTVALDRTWYQVVPSGGGAVPDSGVPTGTLSYRPVTGVTLSPGTAAILLSSPPR